MPILVSGMNARPLLATALALLLLLAAPPGTARAQSAAPATEEEEGPDPGPFAQWRVRLSGGAGIVSNFDRTYLALDLGGGVFLLDGLELGLDVQQWLGSGPLVTKLSPQLRYVFWFVPVITPYLGAFYRHWFITDDIDDIDTVGGRLGVFLARGMVVFGGGAVLEHAFNGCDEDCLFVYPELVLSFSF